MLRAALAMGKGDEFNVVAVNDPFLDVDYMVIILFILACTCSLNHYWNLLSKRPEGLALTH